MCSHFFKWEAISWLFVMRTSLAHHKGKDRRGNKEIIWNHTGWMLLLLLLMWENDWVYCIIHFSQNWGNITEMFSGRLDYTKSWLVIWINSFTEAFIHLSVPYINPFHPPFLSIFPLLPQTINPSFHSAIPPFVHLAILQSLLYPLHPSSVKSPHPSLSSLHPRSVSIFPHHPRHRTDAAVIGTF